MSTQVSSQTSLAYMKRAAGGLCGLQNTPMLFDLSDLSQTRFEDSAGLGRSIPVSSAVVQRLEAGHAVASTL